MLLYPHTMKKAQAELDAVVGRERIPTFHDKDNLPYIRAIVNEILRWRPAAPLCEVYLIYPSYVSTELACSRNQGYN